MAGGNRSDSLLDCPDSAIPPVSTIQDLGAPRFTPRFGGPTGGGPHPVRSVGDKSIDWYLAASQSVGARGACSSGAHSRPLWREQETLLCGRCWRGRHNLALW